MQLVAVIIIIVLIIAAEAMIFGKFALRGLSYSAFVDKAEVYEGDTLQLTEVLENRRIFALPWIKTELSSSRWLAFSKSDSAAQTVGSENTFIPGVFSLRARTRCTRVRRIKALKRGVFSFENTTVTATDLMGFVRVTVSVPVNISITVLPTPADAQDALLSFNEPIGEINVRRFINEDPFIISGSREYSGREPLSRINWNYTAALGKLMVYNNEYSTSRAVLVLMNMQRRGVAPVSCVGFRDAEAYIKLAVKLLDDAVRSGCGCAFATNGGTDRGTEGPYIHTAEQFDAVLRTLAKLDNYCTYDFRDFCGNINFSTFTDIIIITGYIDEYMTEFSDNCRRLGKNAVFYTTGEVPQGDSEHQIIEASRFSFRFNYGGDIA